MHVPQFSRRDAVKMGIGGLAALGVEHLIGAQNPDGKTQPSRPFFTPADKSKTSHVAIPSHLP
jgi:hypothetical protein